MRKINQNKLGGGGAIRLDSDMKRSKSVSQHMNFNNKNRNDGDLLANNNKFLQNRQSPAPSNASTPTAVHPYAPLQSPTCSVSNNSA